MRTNDKRIRFFISEEASKALAYLMTDFDGTTSEFLNRLFVDLAKTKLKQ